jgi:hypothetical protein
VQPAVGRPRPSGVGGARWWAGGAGQHGPPPGDGSGKK